MKRKTDILEYERRLNRELCLRCGVRTYPGRQRQCPKCRHTVSFSTRLQELELLKAYSFGLNASEAVKAVGISYHTAYKAYGRFRAVLLKDYDRRCQQFLSDKGIRIVNGTKGSGKAIIAIKFRHFMCIRHITASPGEIRRMMPQIHMESICYHALRPHSIQDYKVMTDNDSRKSGKHRKFTALEKFWRGFKDSILKRKGVDSGKLIPYLKEYACRQYMKPAQIRESVYESLISPGL